jgi:ABC-type branched-subunit amino acid transport system substrate-binding protein
VVALGATACASEEVTDGPTETATDVVTDTPAGVTAEPCPDAVDERKGCIYLGVLSDVTDGPFTALAVAFLAGEVAFWREVNSAGGLGGYEVDLGEFSRDNRFEAERSRIGYDAIADDVLALAQSLGTDTTRSILDEMARDDMLAVPASWWSGWPVTEQSRGLVLESGASYCAAAISALDWIAGAQAPPQVVQTVGFDDLYGRDVAAGVAAWADVSGAVDLGLVATEPLGADSSGTQDAAVAAILDAPQAPEVVVLAVGPEETRDVVTRAVEGGYTGRFLGSLPTWSPTLVSDDADDATRAAIVERYVQVAPGPPWGADSEAHRAMQAAMGDEPPDNDGFTFGWISQYPLRAAIQAAIDAGDLSREGLVAAVDGLEVDYGGALEPRTYGADASAPPLAESLLAPDPTRPTGVATLERDFVGPTARDHLPDLPCAAPA